jgi:hypothetical protein
MFHRSESAKTNPLLARNCCVLTEAGGAPPPSGEDALRLSSGWHAGRKFKERPARQPPSLASERRDIQGSAKTNPLGASSSGVVRTRRTSAARTSMAPIGLPKIRNKPTSAAELLRLAEAGGAPPPSGEDALRLSSGWHAGRKFKERPARQPPSLASERRDIRKCKNKPTWSIVERCLEGSKDLRGTGLQWRQSDYQKYKTNPLLPRDCCA